MTNQVQTKPQPIKSYGDQILEEYNIKTDRLSGEVYLYDEKQGFYTREFAIINLKQVITSLLGDNYSDDRMKQIINYIKIQTSVDLDKEMHNNCVCLNNGIYDIDANKIIEHSPEIFVTFRIDVEYVPDINMQPWNDYIAGMFHPIDIFKVQEGCGNIFDPAYTTKKIIYFFGDKDSGKSTFILVLQDFFGKQNYSSLSLRDINHGREYAAELYRMKANMCSEIDYKQNFKNIALLKKMSGGDRFMARKLYGHPFEFNSSAKAFFSGNGIPTIAEVDSDDAFYSRWEFIQCPNKFELDDTILSKYTTNDMKSQMFNWLLEGFYRLKKNGWRFTGAMTPEEVYDTFRNAKMMRNTIIDWLNESCMKSDDYEFAEDLFRSCRDWHINRKLTTYPANIQMFGRVFNSAFVQSVMPTTEYSPIDMRYNAQRKAYRGVKLV